MQNQVASSAIHEGMNRLAEDPNQNIGLAKEHVDSEVAGIENPVDVQSRMSHHMVIARMFPWNFAFRTRRVIHPPFMRRILRTYWRCKNSPSLVTPVIPKRQVANFSEKNRQIRYLFPS